MFLAPIYHKLYHVDYSCVTLVFQFLLILCIQKEHFLELYPIHNAHIYISVSLISLFPLTFGTLFFLSILKTRSPETAHLLLRKKMRNTKTCEMQKEHRDELFSATDWTKTNWTKIVLLLLLLCGVVSYLIVCQFPYLVSSGEYLDGTETKNDGKCRRRRIRWGC